MAEEAVSATGKSNVIGIGVGVAIGIAVGFGGGSLIGEDPADVSALKSYEVTAIAEAGIVADTTIDECRIIEALPQKIPVQVVSGYSEVVRTITELDSNRNTITRDTVEQVPVYEPVVDTIVNHPILNPRSKIELTNGDRDQWVHFVNGKEVERLAYEVGSVPDGKICKAVISVSYFNDVPAKE